MRIFRKLVQMLDVNAQSPADLDILTYDAGTGKWVNLPPAAASGAAPDTVNYLVGTASGGLTSEIVVGTTPGGELGGTWASPTVDATHSGSSHASVQAAAEATAAAALSAHASDTTGIHGISDTSALETSAGAQAKVDAHVNDTTDAHDASAISVADSGNNYTATDVEGVLAEIAPQLGAGGPPTGSAGGALDGSYPNPGLAASVAGAGLTETSDVLSVNVDGSTLEINVDTLRIKDGGVTAAKVAADVATQAELDAHVNDTSAAHAASAISADSTTLVGTGTDVQAVLEELDNGIADHLADTSAAHAASAISFSPTGTIAATDVQAAIAEVASEAGGGAGTELAYVELTSDVSVTATTEAGAQTILSSGALSFDGSTRICIEIYSALVIAGSVGGGDDLICNLWDGSTDLNRLAQVRSIAPSGDNVGNGVPIFCRRFLTPSNGSHTFHWKAWRTAANGSISANTTDYLPSYLRITRV